MAPLVIALAALVGFVAGRWCHLWLTDRRQRERLRQIANGGRADMPPWLRRREEQLNRRR